MKTEVTAEGVASSAPEASMEAAVDHRGRPLVRRFTLSSGQQVEQRRMKGQALTDAEQISRGKGGVAYSLAYLSMALKIDGEKILFEDLLEWDSEDVMELLNLAGIGFFAK